MADQQIIHEGNEPQVGKKVALCNGTASILKVIRENVF